MTFPPRCSHSRRPDTFDLQRTEAAIRPKQNHFSALHIRSTSTRHLLSVHLRHCCKSIEFSEPTIHCRAEENGGIVNGCSSSATGGPFVLVWIKRSIDDAHSAGPPWAPGSPAAQRAGPVSAPPGPSPGPRSLQSRNSRGEDGVGGVRSESVSSQLTLLKVAELLFFK